MTLLWCIAILAPSSFLLKCWLAALGTVNIRTNLEETISPCWRPERTWMSTAKIRNQHPTGTRVSESLPRAAFSYRSSSPGSLTRGQVRSESTPFNREATPNDHKDGWPPFEDVNANLVRRFGQSHRRRLEILPCEERRQGRCQGLQSLLHQAYLLMGIFRQLWDRPSSTRSSHSTTLRQGEQSPHQVGELGAGPRHSMMGGLPHDRRAFFPFGSASKGSRPALLWLWVADPWRSRFTAVPRLGNEGFQNFHSQFIGRYNYSGLRFGLRLPAFSFTITCGNLTVGHFRL